MIKYLESVGSIAQQNQSGTVYITYDEVAADLLRSLGFEVCGSWFRGSYKAYIIL